MEYPVYWKAILIILVEYPVFSPFPEKVPSRSNTLHTGYLEIAANIPVLSDTAVALESLVTTKYCMYFFCRTCAVKASSVRHTECLGSYCWSNAQNSLRPKTAPSFETTESGTGYNANCTKRLKMQELGILRTLVVVILPDLLTTVLPPGPCGSRVYLVPFHFNVRLR